MATHAGSKEVPIHVKSLITGEHVNIKLPVTSTVEEVWNQANRKLEESRRDGDTIRCADGTDLMLRLSSTLQDLEDQDVCKGRRFEIRGPSGGAS